MSEADKLFEGLGYEKTEYEDCVFYEKEENFYGETFNFRIEFHIPSKTISISKYKMFLDETYTFIIDETTFKAMNLKYKELGW